MTSPVAHKRSSGASLLLMATGMITVACSIASAIAIAPRVWARSQNVQRPEFEVASIKRTGGRPTYIRLSPEPGRFVAEHVPVKVLIQYAYHVQTFDISGGADWIDTAPGFRW